MRVMFCVLFVICKSSSACIEGCFCRNSPAVIDCLDRGLHEFRIDNETLDKRVYHILAGYNFIRKVNYTSLMEHYPSLTVLDVRGNDNFNCSIIPPRKLKVLAACERAEQPYTTLGGEWVEFKTTSSTKTALQVAGANIVVAMLVGGAYFISIFLRRKRLQQASPHIYTVNTAV